MPSLWFLEIICAGSIVSCVLNPEPNPSVPRYYKSEAECINAIVVVDRLWMTGPNTAYKFNCLPIVYINRG